VKLLLDSHVLFWAALKPESLRPETVDAITDPSSTVLFSAINLWELSIKRAKGKFNFDDRAMLHVIQQQGFTELPVTTRHGLEAAALPPHHADPFDRMLIAQARLEGLTLITSDRTFRHYRVLLMDA
jgi:PIN domain nuclease of toxin-antitoxin system